MSSPNSLSPPSARKTDIASPSTPVSDKGKQSTKVATPPFTTKQSPTPNSPQSTSSAGSPRLIDDMSAAELESALQDTLAKAKKTAWGSEEATPEVLLAMLAMYAIQEVHACGYRPRSAVRAMTYKVKATGQVSTMGCLNQARRELIHEANEDRRRRGVEVPVYRGARRDGQVGAAGDQAGAAGAAGAEVGVANGQADGTGTDAAGTADAQV